MISAVWRKATDYHETVGMWHGHAHTDCFLRLAYSANRGNNTGNAMSHSSCVNMNAAVPATEPTQPTTSNADQMSLFASEFELLLDVWAHSACCALIWNVLIMVLRN